MQKSELNAKVAEIDIPDNMRHLQVSAEGYPIPWFVPYVNHKPEFRAMDGEKFQMALRTKRCWLCGNPLGKWLTFPIGPMCAVTRTTAEPPSHLKCCEYSVKVCPFLTQPKMRRNEKNPVNGEMAGIGIKRNPGVIVLWTCLEYKIFRSGGILFRIGDPDHVEYYSEGRRATKAELKESIESGYPLLMQEAEKDGGVRELEGYKERAYHVLGL